jgi:hypothetical protein
MVFDISTDPGSEVSPDETSSHHETLLKTGSLKDGALSEGLYTRPHLPVRKLYALTSFVQKHHGSAGRTG